MERAKLDRIDRLILRNLQEDGRMTNVELARRASISAPPCLRRVRNLEETGVIAGYHADIDPVALGFGVMLFAQVGLSSQAEGDLRAFEELVEAYRLPEPIEQVGAWLYRVARNRIVDRFRKRKESALPDADALADSAGDDADDAYRLDLALPSADAGPEARARFAVILRRR